MSLADPFTASSSTAYGNPVLGVVRRDGIGSQRIDATGGIFLKIDHSDPTLGPSAKLEKHYMQVTVPKDVTDTYTGLTKRLACSVSIAVSVPPSWGTVAEKADVVDLALAILQDSDFTSTKFVNFQS